MRSFVQVLTTPTADTPGTTLLLHFDNKRYLVGSLAEGTQRACVQMGARLLKVSECFVTGRTEWTNTGGLIGMILTLADSSAASKASSFEEASKKAKSKGKRLGILDDPEKMRDLEDEAKSEAGNTLNIFGPPNLNHTLATARRYVFRKGMPVNVHEIRDGTRHLDINDPFEPLWADENIKVWSMPVLPSRPGSPTHQISAALASRKRSIDEVYATENDHPQTRAEDLTPEERNYLTVKAVVAEMFNSSWRLDTLYETPLSQVKLPATIFVRNPQTNKVERYRGPVPGGADVVPNPDKIVLVRRPWPGALVNTLPPVQPAKEALSYIIRNHMQRGKFHPERAQELKVKKGTDWAALAKGESVQNMEGVTIHPDMVLDPSRVGGGIAVADLPHVDYIDNLLGRPEWREPKVMEGVGAVVWICGKDVAMDPRIHAFMQEFDHLEQIVSSPDYCPNNISLDSAAAATVRLKQVDPDRYNVPVHDAETADGAQIYGGSLNFQKVRRSQPLPKKVHVAARGQTIQLEPSIALQTKDTVPALRILEAAADVPDEVMQEARKAQAASKEIDEDMTKWLDSLPPGAKDVEIITLGTGSALPSKYRNVSATLVRVPGWGNMLLDCGENTLGQLKRVFSKSELGDVLRNLKIIFISHMHADHQLGTTSVIKAWYEEVHDSKPAEPTSPAQAGWKLDLDALFSESRLSIISEPAMQHWLAEYSAIEDYGYSRIAPLSYAPTDSRAGPHSRLRWHVRSADLKGLTHFEHTSRLERCRVPVSLLHLADVEAVLVRHCHGARAVSITFPSGLKVSYSGDCRPSREFSQIGRGSTVCIHEATFDDELQGDAEAKNHSTTSEALGVAQNMGARACVLTHFSQRYQKVPVLERSEDAEPVDDLPITTAVDSIDESTNPEDEMSAPIMDVAETFADQETSLGNGKAYDLPSRKSDAGDPRAASGVVEAVKFKLRSDMKVCVAFDYMRVKIGDIGQLEKFTPALLKLFAEEEKEKEDDGGEKTAAAEKKSKKNKEKNGKRNN